MEVPQFTKEELTLIAAIIAAIGATIAAFISLFSTSRSKYIDTVTITRIAWVRELRGDFSDLLSSFAKLNSADFHKLGEGVRYKLQEKIADLTMLINLKLNGRAPLDREISNLMGILLGKVKEGVDEAQFGDAAGRLMIVVEELLKEEWEKAKYEASGPLRRIPIWWNKIGREDARKQRRKRWLEGDYKTRAQLPGDEQSGQSTATH